MGRKRGRPSRAEVRFAEHVGPTAQTVAKLECDALLGLVERGDLSVDQERAGREINDVWEALERSMARTSTIELMRITASHRELPDAMSHAIARRLHQCHQPWASREIEKTLAPGVTRYGIVWRLCNLNWPPAFIAANTGLNERAVVRALRDSLDVYLDFSKKEY